jgi:DNA-binding transcriptional LysR family regulator
MEFRQLTYFLAAAHTQNFRRAADLCLVTQPALSRQIAALEKELDIVLFTREKQHVRLTVAGKAFVKYAQNALESVQQGQQEFVRWREGLSGTVQIGCNSSLAAIFLPSLLASFCHQYPAIHLIVSVAHSDEVINLVERGEVDLGFIYDPDVRSEVVSMKELFRQPLHLLTRLDHPLARLEVGERTLARIVEEPLIFFGEGARLRKVLNRLLLQRGLSVQPVIEIASLEGLKELVKQGCGVTLLPPALLWQTEQSNGLTLLPLADVSETFLFALIHRRIGTISPPAYRFIQVTTEILETVVKKFSL